MGNSVDDVVWSEFEHNYGDAADIPDLLRACRSPDVDTALSALGDIGNKLYHQGGWVCSAASAALPLLTDLASDPAVHHRHEVVELIGRLACEAVVVAPRFLDAGWQPALDAVRPRLLALLHDPDPLVRRETTVLVADGIRHHSSVAAVARRWRVETDPTTRIDLVLAMGTMCAREPIEWLHAELVALLHADDLQFRLAAVHALAGSENAVAARYVDTLVRAVLHPDAVLWRSSAWIGGSLATLVHATGGLLSADPVAATAFVLGIGRGGDADGRVAVLGQVVTVLSDWRTATGPILPLLAEHLDDDVAEVRYHAAALLACLGPVAAPYADQLAILATDPGRRESRAPVTVGDAAVWALARLDDPRCLPGLVERLSGERLGFTTAGVHFGRGVPGMGQPGIHEVLIPLRLHAGALIGAVAARLASPARDRVLTMNLCEVVAAWGPSAEEALPALVALMKDDDDYVVTGAAMAIGAIGPAGASAARALRRSISVPAAAWALWRTGADPDRGAEAVARHVAEGRGHHPAIALLADLGPLAAASAPLLRDLVGSTGDWTRVEAAHALWRATGDPAESVAVLTDLAEPLAHGHCLPVRIRALGYLAEIGVTTERVLAMAHAIIDNPRRIAYFGGWRTFTEDEAVRAAATQLLA
ncbi:MAG: HEAT repeat domain-containing protein [Umezawaea sp.]